jgi:NAD(P)-dependent dehydrogenase (short-subunit alcohol dehydrogenase family)
MFLTCKVILPLMETQGAGAIINIGALGAVRWTGYAYCAYAASKGAVNSFTQSVALQYAAKGIRANCILPGVMDTPAHLSADLRLLCEPGGNGRGAAPAVADGADGRRLGRCQCGGVSRQRRSQIHQRNRAAGRWWNACSLRVI